MSEIREYKVMCYYDVSRDKLEFKMSENFGDRKLISMDTFTPNKRNAFYKKLVFTVKAKALVHTIADGDEEIEFMKRMIQAESLIYNHLIETFKNAEFKDDIGCFITMEGPIIRIRVSIDNDTTHDIVYDEEKLCINTEDTVFLDEIKDNIIEWYLNSTTNK